MSEEVADEVFREELRDWLSDNLTAEHRRAAQIVAMTDDAWFDVRLDWERRLAAGRWLGISWPERYGGRGGTLGQELIFLTEHGRAGAPYWVGVQGRDLLGPTLLHHGSAEQQDRFLPRIMACEDFWGQGFSEPGAGSDLAGVRTTAVLEGDTWVVDGQKVWTSYGAYANWIYALVRTERDAPAHQGLTLLLIPVDQDGVEIRPIRHLAGGQDFCEVFLTGARTSADLAVGGRGAGWRVAMGSLGIERFTTALPYQARFPHQLAALIEDLRASARLDDPCTRQVVARSWTLLRVLQWSNERLLTRAAAGEDVGSATSLSKLQWGTWHQWMTTAAVDLLGARATARVPGDAADTSAAEFLNARAETIYGGANEIQRDIIGERLLGLPRHR